jgi:DNA topoisomerase-2
MHTTVHFIITLTKEGQNAIAKDGMEKAFKLASTISTSNMVVFDSEGKIRKYATPEQILDDFYDLRLTYYQKRKASVYPFSPPPHFFARPQLTTEMNNL